jgi:hypothetical protein
VHDRVVDADEHGSGGRRSAVRPLTGRAYVPSSRRCFVLLVERRAAPRRAAGPRRPTRLPRRRSPSSPACRAADRRARQGAATAGARRRRRGQRLSVATASLSRYSLPLPFAYFRGGRTAYRNSRAVAPGTRDPEAVIGCEHGQPLARGGLARARRAHAHTGRWSASARRQSRKRTRRAHCGTKAQCMHAVGRPCRKRSNALMRGSRRNR